MKLIDDISDFLGRHGFEVTHQSCGNFETIRTSTNGGNHEKAILPLEICAGSEEEAQRMGDAAAMCVARTANALKLSEVGKLWEKLVKINEIVR